MVVAHHSLELLQLSSLLSQLFSLLPVYLLFEYQVVSPDLVVPIFEFITALYAGFYLRFQLQNSQVTLSKFSSQGTERTVFVLLFEAEESVVGLVKLVLVLIHFLLQTFLIGV